MDAKITLSFDKSVIVSAKKYAESNNISISRLTEYLLSKVVMKRYKLLEDIPVSDWVSKVAEGKIEYKTRKRTRKDLKNEYLSTRR